jgi:hypothetical protein
MADGKSGTEHSIAHRQQGKIQMTSLDELKTTVRRNKLLGMCAAGKLGLSGRDAEAYADALAVGTVDPERSDVFNKVRKDFDAAGVIQSDEQILRVMNELMLQAANQVPATQEGAADARPQCHVAMKLNLNTAKVLDLAIPDGSHFKQLACYFILL